VDVSVNHLFLLWLHRFISKSIFLIGLSLL